MIADIEQKVLTLCAEGYSNKTISVRLGVDVGYLSGIIEHHLGFPGWKVDLDVNPLDIFFVSRGLTDFIEKTKLVSPYLEDITIILAYRNCMIFIKNLERAAKNG